jgi:hypothetical protein
MKNIFAVVFIALLLVSSVAFSQPNAYTTKDMNLSAGVGIGMYGIYGSSSTPPIFVAFDAAVPSISPKVSLGGIVAYSGSSDDFGYGKWSYTYIVIAARGDYHFLENNQKIDAYGGLGLGYTIVSSSVTWNNATYQNLFGGYYSASASYFFYDFHVGGRYYFSPKFGVMAELGYGVGFLRLGVTYKLN